MATDTYYISIDKIRTINPKVGNALVPYVGFQLYRSNKQYQHLYLANTQGLDEGGNLQLVNSTLDNNGKPTQYTYSIMDNPTLNSTENSDFTTRYKSENYRFFNLQKGVSGSLGYRELDITNSKGATTTFLAYKNYYTMQLGEINNYALAYKYNQGIKNGITRINKFNPVSVNGYNNLPAPNLGLVPASGSFFHDSYNSDTTKWDSLAKTSIDGDCGYPNMGKLMNENMVQSAKDTFHHTDPKATTLHMFSSSDLYPESKRRANHLMNQDRKLTDYSLLIKNLPSERESNVSHTNYQGLLPENNSKDSSYEIATIDTSSHTSGEIKRFGLLRLIEVTYDWRFNSMDFENPPKMKHFVNHPKYYAKWQPTVSTGDTVTGISGTTVTCSSSVSACKQYDRIYTDKGYYIGTLASTPTSGSNYTLIDTAEYNPINGQYYTGPLYRAKHTEGVSNGSGNNNPWSGSNPNKYLGTTYLNTFNFRKYEILGNTGLSENLPWDRDDSIIKPRKMNLLQSYIRGGGALYGIISDVYMQVDTAYNSGDNNGVALTGVQLPWHTLVISGGESSLSNWAKVTNYWDRGSSLLTNNIVGFIHPDTLMHDICGRSMTHDDDLANITKPYTQSGSELMNYFKAVSMDGYGTSQQDKLGLMMEGTVGLVTDFERWTNGASGSTTLRTNFPDSLMLNSPITSHYCSFDTSGNSLIGSGDSRASGAQLAFKPLFVMGTGAFPIASQVNGKYEGTTTNVLANIHNITGHSKQFCRVNHAAGYNSGSTDTINVDDGSGGTYDSDYLVAGDWVYRNNSGTTADFVGIVESNTGTQIVFVSNIAVTLADNDFLKVSKFHMNTNHIGLNMAAQNKMITIRTTDLDFDSGALSSMNNWIRHCPNLTGCYLVSNAGKIHGETKDGGTIELTNPDMIEVSGYNVVPDKIHKIISHTCRNKGAVQFHDIIIDNVNSNNDYKKYYKLFRPAHVAINDGAPNKIMINTMNSDYTKKPSNDKKRKTFTRGTSGWHYVNEDKKSFNNIGRAQSDANGVVYPDPRVAGYNEAALSMYLIVDSDASNYTASADYSFLEHRKHNTYFKSDSIFKLGTTYEIGITDGKSKKKLSMTPMSDVNGTYLQFGGKIPKMNGIASIGEVITLTTGSPINTDIPESARIGSTVTIASEAEDIIQDILSSNEIDYTKFSKDYPYYVAPNIQGANINNTIKFLAGFKNKDIIIDVDDIKLQSKSSGLRKTNIELSTTSDLINVISVNKKKSTFGFYNHVTVYGNGVKSIKQDSRSIKNVGKKSLEEYDSHLLTKAEVEDKARRLLTQHNLDNLQIEVEVFDKNIGLLRPGDIVMVNMPDEQIDVDSYMVFEMLHGQGGTVTMQLGRYRQGLETTLAEMMTQNKKTISRFRGNY